MPYKTPWAIVCDVMPLSGNKPDIISGIELHCRVFLRVHGLRMMATMAHLR